MIGALNTDRMVAHRLDRDDLRELCALHRDTEVMKFLGGAQKKKRNVGSMRIWTIGHIMDLGYGYFVTSPT
jgi:hypothetical protein